MGRLSNKTLALILKHHHLEPLLIQLPHSLHIHERLERLRELVPNLDNRFRYALSERYKIILLCAFPPLRQSSNALQVLYSLRVRQEHTQKYWKNRLHHCSCNSREASMVLIPSAITLARPGYSIGSKSRKPINVWE